MQGNKTETSSRTLHEVYVGIIALIIIAALIAIIITRSTKLFEYVNAGVAISSLILALIAIGMTIFGNSKLEEHFQALRNTLIEAKQTTDQVTIASNNLGKEVNTLASVIHSIEKNVSGYDVKLNEISQNLRNNQNQITPIDSKGIEDGKTTSVDSDDINIIKFNKKKFIDNASFVGKLTLYIFATFAKHRIILSLEDLEKHNDEFNRFYTFGFLVACSSTGFLSFGDNKSKGDAFIISPNKIDIENSLSIKDIILTEINPPDGSESSGRLDLLNSAEAFINEASTKISDNPAEK